MNFIDIFYRSEDGLRLYARDHVGPTPQAPVIVCLPGLTRNSKDFMDLARVLSATHRVICPDLRGRGRSARDPDATHYRPDRYVQDVITLLDVLKIEEVTLIGTSLGGLMAMIMIATQPGCVRAAVLNDVGPEVDPAGLARIAGYVGKTAPVDDWRAAAAQTEHVNGVAFPDYTSEDWMMMARELFIQEGTTPVLDYDPAIALGVANGSAAANLWPLFEKLPAKPLLVLRGESSDILSPQTLQRMAQQMPSLSSVTVPNRGHAPSLAEPVARSAILAFIERVS